MTEFIKIVFKNKLLILLLIVLVIACLYIPRLATYEPIFTKDKRATEVRPFTDEEIERLEDGFEDQIHPRLLQLIRTKWILPPSAKPLNIAVPARRHFSQHGQSESLDKILHQKTNGFFVECGAHDGETNSNSLFFERERNWTGLLIETDMRRFERLKGKNRKAFSTHACLNSKNTSGKARFGLGLGLNALADEKLPALKFKRYTTVQCFTLYSLMKALNRTKIDFFSLDVEGAELAVLKTIPFSHLDIDILVIEYYAWGGTKEYTENRFIRIDSFITSKGYDLINRTWVDSWYRKKINS